MKEPSLSDFGLTEDQVASARKSEQRVDSLGGALFLGWVPGWMIVCGLLISALTGIAGAGILGIFVGFPISIILGVAWVLYRSSLPEREFSRTIRKHAEFTKAVEDYQKQLFTPPSGFEKRGSIVAPHKAQKEVAWFNATPEVNRRADKAANPAHIQESQSKTSVDNTTAQRHSDLPQTQNGSKDARSEHPREEAQADSIVERGNTPTRSEGQNQKLKEEVTHPVSSGFSEGSVRQITLTTYERNPRARRACLDHHGSSCSVCGIDFGERYGELGEGFIHVHHLRPLSEIAEDYEVNPITDLIPVCPNCHAMLHLKTPPLSTDELRVSLTIGNKHFGGTESPNENELKVGKPRRSPSKKVMGKPPAEMTLELVWQDSKASKPLPVTFTRKIPANRVSKLMDTANTWYAEGVNTPEKLAGVLNDFGGGKLIPFSQSLWFALKASGVEGVSSPDWPSIYNDLK